MIKPLGRHAASLLPLGAITVVVTLLCAPLILYGPQDGHDLILALPWSKYFAIQFLEGEFYPRWIQGLYGGAGSPVFFYYPPLPFVFSSVTTLLCGGCEPQLALGQAQWLMVLASSWSFFWFARYHVSALPAAVGALCYGLAPYHFATDLLFRQAFSELCGFIWIPLVFGAIDRLRERPWAVPILALSYAMMLFSHLPTVLLVSPFFLLYAVMNSLRHDRPRILLPWMLGTGLGFLLAGCYLLPALLTQEAVSMEDLWGGRYDPVRWLFFGAAAQADKQPFFEVGLGTAALALACLPAWMVRPAGSWTILPGFLLVALLAIWFLVSVPSAWIWSAFGVLQKVQFPWRLFVLHDFVVAAMASLAISWALQAGSLWGRLYGALLICAGLALCLVFAVGRYTNQLEKRHDPAQQQRLQYVLATGYSATEYLPPAVTVRVARLVATMAASPTLMYNDQNGRIEVLSQEPRALEIAVDLNRPTQLTVKQLNYPGWTASLWAAEEFQGLLDIETMPHWGAIRLQLPPGQYLVRLKLDARWPEALGWALSAIGLLLLTLSVLWSARAKE